MISVDEALHSLLRQVERAQPSGVSLDSALGLVLAEPLESKENHPSEDTSAMDGYAVRVEDLKEASEQNPVTLTQVDDIRAGFPSERTLAPGQTARISTGALAPAGAQAVVMREDVIAQGERITFRSPAAGGWNLRRAGEHIRQGERVVEEGAVLSPPEIGMAAYLGYQTVLCYPRVRVAVLSTGSELVETGGELSRGQIRDSNGISLATALQAMGCVVEMRERVPDTEEALDQAFQKAFSSCHVVLTSGGISAGWHDLVRGRIEAQGGQFHFHKLKMRPGKPLAFGMCGSSHFFCLPGNPVSTMVTFEVFVKPALRKLMGRPVEPLVRKARLAQKIVKKEGFTIFYRGIMDDPAEGEPRVRLTGPQGSHMLRSLTQANVLIRAEEKDGVMEEGSLVSVLPFYSAERALGPV